uniref:Ecdysone-inducible protein E75 n=1 Tax=Laodelphax striatellus TaxID=195883 RepID=A0A2H4QXA1_LAOST|nr:ecdysone-inducible protein E75 [Laodelphax striatellus]
MGCVSTPNNTDNDTSMAPTCLTNSASANVVISEALLKVQNEKDSIIESCYSDIDDDYVSDENSENVDVDDSCTNRVSSCCCQGFFRRSIQQKIQYRPCTKNQQCSILRINRNRCQYCRLKKCIAVGMSRDAVRFGRVPKREKARILAAMQQSTNSRSQEKALAAELEDEQRLLATVVRAHIDTCDFTRDKIEPMILRARQQPSYTACPPTLACPLNPNPQPLTGQQELLQDFSKRFSPAIRGVVEFAKRIPGFSFLAQDDQVTLLKAGVFEVLLVRLACMFDSQNNSMICLNGQILKRESIHNSSNARFLMDSMFDFAERLNALRLSDAEIGLFCSIVVIAADRPGLRNTDLIERMHNKLKTVLQLVLNQNHPGQPNLCHELMKKIPDLRTLNTLHSEKLLAFKMTEQQQLAQQQQQMWGSMMVEDECNSKSPGGASSWSSSSDVTMEEVKSPLGSVSSTESMCSGEVASLNDYHQSHHASSTPLLAATLAGGVCPHRHRANSGSASGDDIKSHHRSFRKLDSPSDSGIESGTEKLDKPIGSAPTSVCSSPRSSLEDKDDHHHHPHHPPTNHHHAQNGHSMPFQSTQHQPAQQNGTTHSVEDMPVLKRVLQAPPLYDTNSLMDEAYKPHKKFRALRNKDSAEAEPMVHNSPQLHHHLTSSLSSTHSTLAKSLMESPRMTPEQLKRTEMINDFIMRAGNDSAASSYQSYPAAQRWQAGTSVITTTSAANAAATSPSAYILVSTPPPAAAASSRMYLSPSPSSSTSPHSPSVMELQVGIANSSSTSSSQQPLNLSKKTPPPSPTPLSHPPPTKVVKLEA